MNVFLSAVSAPSRIGFDTFEKAKLLGFSNEIDEILSQIKFSSVLYFTSRV